MRGFRTGLGAGGRRLFERSQALVVAVAVVLAIALAGAAVVIAETIEVERLSGQIDALGVAG